MGVGSVRGFGGCNDLIFSGHGALWILTPLLFHTYYRPVGRLGWWMIAFMWILILQTNIRDVMDEQHYSVDMIVAAVVTTATWHWTKWVYDPELVILPRNSRVDTKKTKIPPSIAALIVGCLAFVGIVIIYGKS